MALLGNTPVPCCGAALLDSGTSRYTRGELNLFLFRCAVVVVVVEVGPLLLGFGKDLSLPRPGKHSSTESTHTLAQITKSPSHQDRLVFTHAESACSSSCLRLYVESVPATLQLKLYGNGRSTAAGESWWLSNILMPFPYPGLLLPAIAILSPPEASWSLAHSTVLP